MNFSSGHILVVIWLPCLREEADMIHAKCLVVCFVITALGAEKLVHHVFCHDSTGRVAPQLSFQSFIIQSCDTRGVCWGINCQFLGWTLQECPGVKISELLVEQKKPPLVY